MMINKCILQLLPLSLLSLLLSCSDLVKPLQNLPDGYARVSVFNYSDIPVSVAFDSGEYSDLDTKGAATENDEVVALAGFSSTFFDVKVPGESRKVWLKIPAGTDALELTLTPNSTREFTTGLESIYKRRVRLKFYNYGEDSPVNIKNIIKTKNEKGKEQIKIDQNGNGGILKSDEKGYLDADFDPSKPKKSDRRTLKAAVTPGTPQITNVDLIVSDPSSIFKFDWTGTSFGKNETELSEETFSVGPDDPKEYVYYSGMKCRFTVTFDGVGANKPSSYDSIGYTFQRVGENLKSPVIFKVSLLVPDSRQRSKDTPISYSPTERFEYDLVIAKYLKGKKVTGSERRLSDFPDVGNFVCTRNPSEPQKVKVYYGASGFSTFPPSTP